MQPNYTYTNYIPGEVDMQEMLQSPLIWKQFQERWASCSQRLSDILFGTETMSKMIDLSVEFELTDDQTANVSRAIRDIVLGYIYIGDLAELLQKQLGVDNTLASKIGGRMIDILRPAMEEIKNVQRAHFRNRIEQSASPDETKANATNNVLNLRK